MMKKILIGLLTMIMTVGSISLSVNASEYTYGDYVYNILDDGTVEIVNYYGDDSVLEIPNEIDGMSVASIGAETFFVCHSLTSVTIPDSVTSIVNDTFYQCTNLTDVAISASVTDIGIDAFLECESITNITVDSNNEYYSSLDGVLYNKDQTTLIYCPNGKDSVTIPDSVVNIADYAFSECYNLTSITIPDSVTSVGEGAFTWCEGLTSITIPDSLNSIEMGTFYACSSLTSITIPNSVTSIGDTAFEFCENLKSITIPNSVASIGDEVFDECNNIVIHCYNDSYAKQYAIDNEIEYDLLDSSQTNKALIIGITSVLALAVAASVAVVVIKRKKKSIKK